MKRLGIDVGSTTVKLVVLDENDKIVYKKYERHMSNVFSKVSELLAELKQSRIAAAPDDETIYAAITGSGGLSLSNLLDVPFEQ